MFNLARGRRHMKDLAVPISMYAISRQANIGVLSNKVSQDSKAHFND